MRFANLTFTVTLIFFAVAAALWYVTENTTRQVVQVEHASLHSPLPLCDMWMVIFQGVR